MTQRHRLTYALIGLGVVGLGAATAAMIGVGGPEAYAAPPVRNAGPNTLGAVLRSASGGERIVLAAGDYGDVRFPHRDFSPALQIDATKAHFTNVTVQGAGGVSITGGRVDGPRKQHATVLVDSAHDVQIRHMQTSGSVVGVAVSRSRHVVVADNIFDGIASDGVNVAGAQDVSIERNVCRNFTPTPATYDSTGKLVKDGNHPDCIQGWSIRGKPPLADISIIGNTGRGFMQGIFFGNSGQGGIDRIVVRDNTFDISAFNGIVVMDARNGRISHNTVRTIPGARMVNRPSKPITAWIKIGKMSTNVVVCSNTVDNPRFSDDQGACRDGKP